MGAVFALCLAAVVFALGDKQIIHVFPTNVASEGWSQDTQALEQTLGGNALAADFTKENSAYVTFARDADAVRDIPDVPQEVDREELQGAWGDTDAGVGTASEAEPTVTTTTEEETPTEIEEETPITESTDTDTAVEPEGVDSAPVSTDSTPTEASADEVAPVELPPVEPQPETEPVVPMPDVTMFEYLDGALRGVVARMVYAQEAPSLEAEIVEDQTLSEEDPTLTSTDPATETPSPDEDVVPSEEDSSGLDADLDESGTS
jgi:hypothetical protein